MDTADGLNLVEAESNSKQSRRLKPQSWEACRRVWEFEGWSGNNWDGASGQHWQQLREAKWAMETEERRTKNKENGQLTKWVTGSKSYINIFFQAFVHLGVLLP